MKPPPALCLNLTSLKNGLSKHIMSKQYSRPWVLHHRVNCFGQPACECETVLMRLFLQFTKKTVLSTQKRNKVNPFSKKVLKAC